MVDLKYTNSRNINEELRLVNFNFHVVKKLNIWETFLFFMNCRLENFSSIKRSYIFIF